MPLYHETRHHCLPYKWYGSSCQTAPGQQVPRLSLGWAVRCTHLSTGKRTDFRQTR